MTDMLLFLDFDGVLHPVSGSKPFQPNCMEVLISTLADYPEIRIVVTSSWREEKSLEELEMLLGPSLGQRIIGTTPIIDDPFLHHVRYHEVQYYLQGNAMENIPWFALDDEPGNYPENAPAIITNRVYGLTTEDGPKLRELINHCETNYHE